MKLLIATTNQGKVREIGKLISDLPITILHLGDPSIPSMPESPEDGKTFEENAIQKAKHYGTLSKIPTVAEDAGLEIPSLNNWPGVNSARVADTDAKRVQLALQKLHGKSGEDRKGRFVSVVAFFDPENNRTEIFRGTVEGEILEEPRGHNGFGYDPIFYYPALGKTFAELTSEGKNAVSHRGKSFSAFAFTFARAKAKATAD
ncbi:MAG: RdgB/HAM1 family non-canonical purine NTP pyrophosphatase [bacterium]|nr:RdgB/HAM1 family non-canonical purine NTP pyrophosphatase [bacterium]